MQLEGQFMTVYLLITSRQLIATWILLECGIQLVSFPLANNHLNIYTKPTGFTWEHRGKKFCPRPSKKKIHQSIFMDTLLNTRL